MEELSFAVGASIVTLFFWFLLNQFYNQRYEVFVKSFLDSNTNITVLFNQNKITFMNKTALDFFGFKSLKEFNAVHSSLSNLFLTQENYIDKYSYGKNWIKFIYDEKRDLKVKLLSKKDERIYHFYIKVSKIKKGNQYLLSLNNITLLEQEKLKIQELAEYDVLTKVYNRVKLNEVLASLIYRANRYDLKFSIILLDIDFFKAINDTHGHNRGDSVLVSLARLLNMNLRESDTFARWGGEEFVVALESTAANDAARLAERLRREVESFSFDDVGRVTCSFGVTEFKAGDTLNLLFERVDEALYEAKRNGRNQVVSK